MQRIVAILIGTVLGIVAAWKARSAIDVALRTLLSLPDEVSPYIILTLGHPDGSPEAPPRLAIDEIAFMEEYGKEWSL